MRRLKGTESMPRQRVPQTKGKDDSVEVNDVASALDLDRLLLDFGVASNDLRRAENRRDVMLRGVLEQLQEDLKELEGKYGRQDSSKTTLRRKQTCDDQDVLSWLKLPGDNMHLKRILRTKLVKLLSEEGNMIRIADKLGLDTQSSSRSDLGLENKAALQRSSSKKWITGEFICNQPEIPEGLCAGKTYGTSVPKTPSNKDSQAIDSMLMAIKVRKRQAIINLDAENTLLNKYKLNGPLTTRWSAKDEANFHIDRRRAQKATHGLVPSSNRRDCGLISFVRKHLSSENTKSFREKILSKWMDGHPLTVPELRFIAYTSDSLSSMVDRQFYQAAVDNIDPELLDDLELILAGEILHGYWTLLNHTQSQRVTYLNRINSEKRVKNDFFQQKAESWRSSKETLYRRIKSQRAAKFNCLNKLSNSTNMITKSTQDKADQRQTVNSVFFGKLDSKEYRLKLHPQSKLLLNSSSDRRDEVPLNLLEVDRGLSRPKLESAYRVIASRDTRLIDSQKFIKTYSAGPQSHRAVATQDLKHKAATVIQKYVRSRLARREFIRLRTLKADRKAISKFIEPMVTRPAPIDIGAARASSKASQPVSPASRLSPISLRSKHSRQPSAEPKFLLSVVGQENDRPQTAAFMGKVRASLLAPVSEGPLPAPLYVKQRFLMNSVKRNRLDLVEKSTHVFFPKDVNVADLRGNTPLYYAGHNGSADFCKFLVSRGALINHQCEGGRTALHTAFQSGSSAACLYLIHAGANLDTTDRDGLTPVAYGCPKLLSSLGLSEGVSFATKPALDAKRNLGLFNQPRIKNPARPGFAVSCFSSGIFLSKPPPKDKIELEDDIKAGFI